LNNNMWSWREQRSTLLLSTHEYQLLVVSENICPLLKSVLREKNLLDPAHADYSDALVLRMVLTRLPIDEAIEIG